MLAQAFGRVDEDDTFLGQLLLDVRISGLAVELGLDAGEILALLLGDAETLEGLFDIVGDFVPAPRGGLALGEIITDVLEDDVLEILARPVGRHGFGEKHLESLLAEFTDPLGLSLDVGDVIDGTLVEAVAGVVGIVLGVGEVPLVLVDGDGLQCRAVGHGLVFWLENWGVGQAATGSLMIQS